MPSSLRGDARRIQLVLADDHHLVRCGIAALLQAVPSFQVLAQVGTGPELMQVLERLAPDVVVIDTAHRGSGGLDAIAAVRARHPSVRVLALCSHGGADLVAGVLASGAGRFVPKSACFGELRQALEALAGAEGSALPADGDAPAFDLTPRQTQIVVRLARGQSTKEIVYEMGISRKTVDQDRERIQAQLGAKDVATLTRYALRHGLIAP